MNMITKKLMTLLTTIILLLGLNTFGLNKAFAWYNTSVQTETLYCGDESVAKMGATTQYAYIGPAADRTPLFYSALIASGSDWGSEWFYPDTVRIEVSGSDPLGNPLSGDAFGDLEVLSSPDESGVEQEILRIVYDYLVTIEPTGLLTILKHTITSGGAIYDSNQEKAWGQWQLSFGQLPWDNLERGLRFRYSLLVDHALEGTYTINIHYHARVYWTDATFYWDAGPIDLYETVYYEYVNTPVTPSTPSGPTSGYRDTSYSYSTSTTDPNGDSLRYQFYWGDGSYTTTGWYTSGATASASHSWSSTGYKYVKVRAQDSTGAWSHWSSSLTVNIVGTPTYLFDGDFLEGWSCSGGALYTFDGIGCLMIYSGYSSAVMTKSWTFNSEVLEFATVSCTCLPIDSWRFEARRASDGTWLYGPNSTSAETKTWAITEWYTGEIDKVGIRIFGDSGPGVSFDYITITNNVTLTITTGFGGTTDPAPGTHEYFEKKSVQVTAIPDTNYYFMYWRLDGQLIHGNPITVTTDSDHTLRASFSSGGGCPTLFVWNGSDYVDYGVINIHDVENDVVREVHVQAEDVSIAGYKVKFRLREGWEGLNYSHSLIDQVKLYAVDSEGNRYLCPLIKAKHIEQGRVLLNLLFSDDYRIDTYLMDTIDLTFKVPYPAGTIENFTFIIEGHNPLKQ